MSSALQKKNGKDKIVYFNKVVSVLIVTQVKRYVMKTVGTFWL